jgi:hypothetical protein
MTKLFATIIRSLRHDRARRRRLHADRRGIMPSDAFGYEKAHEQIREQSKQHEKLQKGAVDRVKPWPRKLQVGDYDFRSWATGASKNRLVAGAIYEYARESRKLCGLLALMNPKRLRENWEMVRPAMIDGGRPTESNPAPATPLSCSFEDLDEYDAERALGGSLYCLAELADDLADNISFGELFRTKRDETEKAFGGLDQLSRLKREFRYFWPVFDAVEVATQSEVKQATVLETVSHDEKRFILGEACSEVIAIRIRWRFTDSEIEAGMKKFVRAHRPRNQAYKPRQPKKGSRRDSARSALGFSWMTFLACATFRGSPIN